MTSNSTNNPNLEEQQQQAVTESYDSRIIAINRTTKVREGGKDFSFAALAVVGDGKGNIGYGRGKAKEVMAAVQKAHNHARRNMVKIELRGETLQYPIKTKYGAVTVMMKPANTGTGIIAGGPMRAIFEVLGVKNVVGKCIGSTNPVNVVHATFKSLSSMVSPLFIAKKRGKTLKEIWGKKEHVEQ
jgi:small subunit ribosomal protein S5